MNKREKAEFYIKHVEDSIEKAKQGQSKCDPFVGAINGLSTPTFRHTLNNICSIEGMTYLEIGCWTGGTICGACNNNKSLTAYAVDNFFYPEGWHKDVRDTLLNNINTVKPSTGSLDFFEKDCFSLDKSLIEKPVDVYFFDAGHDEDDQKRALTEFIDKMNDVFIFIVDDYNWPQVQIGTQKAIKELAGTLKLEKEWVYLTGDGFDPTWHNGVYFSVLSKI